MIKNLSIYKNVLYIGIPVFLENLVYNLINFIDNFMVGRENIALGLGTNAVAGLGISNQLFFVFIVSLFGMFSGASVLSSQYFGNKDYKNMNKILGFLCIASLIVSLPFLLIGLFNPLLLLQYYSKDNLTLIQAIKYFQIASITFPIAGVGFAFSMQLRVIRKSKYAFYASLLGLMFNFIINLILIPIFGVQGAAIATVLSRLFSLIFMIYICIKKEFPIVSNFKNMIPHEISLIKDIAKISFPTFIHEVLWVLGINFRSSMYSNIGSLEFASIVTALTISSILFSMFSGVSNATSVMIGNELGANNIDKAEINGKVSIRLMVIIAILLSLILNLISPLILNLMNVSNELNTLTRKIVFIDSLFLIFKSTNLLFVVGILRAGGDIFYPMILDILGMWIVSVPLVYITKLYNFDISIIFFCASLSEVVVSLPIILRYKKKKWLKRIIKN